MYSVLTGDIINSRKVHSSLWLPLLKESLDFYGKQPVQWEIFRGDSFQLLVPAHKALLCALHIKASVKQLKDLDVRIGIGIGEMDFKGKKITESNGSAFIRSGECFESLKKQTMAICSGTILDRQVNLMLALGLLIMDTWSPTVAAAIKTSIEHPDKNQTQLAKMLKRSQSSISEALTRGGFAEVMDMNDFFQNEMDTL